jgi:hypothetical protein
MKILFQPYATKRDIQELMGGARWESAAKVFSECKKLEKDPFKLRPTRVPSHLVFKVLGMDYDFTLHQYEQTLKLQQGDKK